jgi:DNA-3-methyladenine glycosylase II
MAVKSKSKRQSKKAVAGRSVAKKSAAKKAKSAAEQAIVRKPTPAQVKALARVIETDAHVLEGMQELRRICPVMRKIHDLAGDPPLRRREPGFEGLLRIIVAQQLSVASAAAIWTKFENVLQPMTAQALLGLTDEQLRAAGMSRPKMKTLRAVAQAVADGLDLEKLAHIDEEVARAQLVAVSGIGPWTADIFLMFCLGRADVFAPGDLALQVAAQIAMSLDERPSIKEMAEIAERWSPWRGVAARMLWSYYKVAKASKSGLPV